MVQERSADKETTDSKRRKESPDAKEIDLRVMEHNVLGYVPCMTTTMSLGAGKEDREREGVSQEGGCVPAGPCVVLRDCGCILQIIAKEDLKKTQYP